MREGERLFTLKAAWQARVDVACVGDWVEKEGEGGGWGGGGGGGVGTKR